MSKFYHVFPGTNKFTINIDVILNNLEQASKLNETSINQRPPNHQSGTSIQEPRDSMVLDLSVYVRKHHNEIRDKGNNIHRIHLQEKFHKF